MPNTTEPRWLLLARAFLTAGIREFAGSEAHPLITFFLDKFTQLEGQAAARSDETKWCSAFACGVMELSGYASPHHALARSWDSYGEKLDTFKRGCIVTLCNDNHVGFGVDVDMTKRRIYLLGGNQNNTVNISPYLIDRVVTYRWPHDVVIATEIP